MRKKGDLHWSLIFGIILAIIAAAVIYYWIRIYPKDYDRAACRASVNLRSVEFLDQKPINTPLRCKTQEVNITTINEEEIKRNISNHMFDCWGMLGRGKKDFFDNSLLSSVGLEKAKAACMICSTITFSERVRSHIAEVDITDYLETKKIPSTIYLESGEEQNMTYMTFLSDTPNAKLPTDMNISPMDTRQDYMILFVGVRGDSLSNVLKDFVTVNAIAAGSTYVFGGVKGLVGLGQMVVKQPYIALIGELAYLGPRTFLYFNNVNLANQYCYSDEERGSGCYALILAPFDQETITKYCQRIESIP